MIKKLIASGLTYFSLLLACSSPPTTYAKRDYQAYPSYKNDIGENEPHFRIDNNGFYCFQTPVYWSSFKRVVSSQFSSQFTWDEIESLKCQDTFETSQENYRTEGLILVIDGKYDASVIFLRDVRQCQETKEAMEILLKEKK
ncbi:hypothetical protein HYX14_02985 [Candidatus Woesearchaeota archaeon]|nr:hypothetical protein [Candidatus Woesearchaeota archaeon]